MAVVEHRPLDPLPVEVELGNAIGEPVEELEAVGVASFIVADVKEEDVVSLNRLHGPTGCLLDAGTNLSCLLIAPLSVSLALPERDSQRLPSLAVAENHVSDVTSLVANAWVNDVADNTGDIGDALGCRLKEIHSRKHFLTSHQALGGKVVKILAVASAVMDWVSITPAYPPGWAVCVPPQAE